MKLITVFICCQKINQRFGRFNLFLSIENGLSSTKELTYPEIIEINKITIPHVTIISDKKDTLQDIFLSLEFRLFNQNGFIFESLENRYSLWNKKYIREEM